ncbi:MAG: tetratricopeptide repeat protein, partial [Planctomycetes bacterium]|nr:tetratricopeptide repeat protein [Planctomycetota bacterium]
MHEESVRHFHDFLKATPNHRLAAEAHYRAGVSEAELGRADAAIASLRQALQRGGADFRLRPECRYRLGNLLEGKAEHAAAAEQFGKLGAEVDGEHYLRAAAAFAEGECRRELGDDGAAARCFAASAESATGEQQNFRFPALYQLGFCLLRTGALEQAAQVFGLAAESGPDDAARGECLYLQGDALLRREAYDEAAAAFERSLRLPSEFRDDAQFGLGWVALGKDDQRAARAAFARVVSEHGKSPLVPKARLELGRSLYRDGEFEQAQNALAPLAGDGVPAEVQREAREINGLCALASGAGERAVETLQKAVTEAPAGDRPRLSFALGEAFANLSRWADAAAAYAEVPAAAGNDLYGDALYGRCYALHQLGRHAESIAQAEALRALTPPHRLLPDATFAIGENLFLMQRHAEAAREYGKLEGDAAFGPRAKWKLAWCAYLDAAKADGGKAEAAARFAALAATDAPFAEEALAMAALARLEAGDGDGALDLADRYRAKHQDGAFLDRTERVAARVLRQRGNLAAAQKRLERAAAA